MKGKTNLGKVLLSVVIATAMLTSTIPAIAGYNTTTNSSNNDNGTPKAVVFEPTPPAPPVGTIVPNGVVVLYENFTTGLGSFVVNNLTGDGNYSWNASGWVDWTYGTDNTDAEDDYLNVTVNLTAWDPACTGIINLEFYYWGDGGEFYVEVDGTDVGNQHPYTATATVTEENVDLTAYAGQVITLSFHTTGTTNRNFSIDDVLISANVATDIYINGIENMVDGGRYNTFPKTIMVNVSNLGAVNATDIDFHLQIYKEQPYEPESYHCWDLESCFLITWDTISADGDQATWYWTEKRSHSPTHSYACKPDYLETYDANSEDYLVLHDWFTIPTEVNGKTVHAAYLNFSYWVQGEFDGTNPVDYGMVYIINATGTYPVGGPYYDSDGEWKYAEIDISAFIGQDIKIQFGWFSDDYLNYEGMYVDDICINLAYTSAQPLVFQGYKYTDLAANETKTIQFPIEFDPDEGTYYIQVYSDYEDCVPDNHGLGHGYADEINYTIWFGDVCDAAVTDVTAPAEVLFHWDTTSTTNYVLVPINVTVYNNGTLTEDVPVKVSAKHKLIDKEWYDDVESGDQGYSHPEWGGEGHWNIVDFDFYSPYHAWYFGDPASKTYPAGVNAAFMLTPEGTVDWDAMKAAAEADIVFKAKWDLVDPDFICPIIVNGNTWYFFISRSLHLNGSSGGWTEVKLSDLFAGYVSYYGLDSFLELPDLYGFTDFKGFGIGICGPGLAPTVGGSLGFLFDDIMAYRVYEGEEVWSTVYTVEDLEPGETASFEVVWNTTEYCDYVISAEIQLDCDQDPNNNIDSTITRIYDELFTDEEAIGCDDNTYGLPDHWRLVEECSICPTNHFWYNGEDTGNYTTNMDEILVIDKTFNFTGVTEAYFNFTTKYWIESGWDYGYVEVSNDSGMHWFIVEEFTGNTGGNWTNVSIHLVPGVTTLTSPYTGLADFIMPANFFTANMHFRFRFYSDELVTEKGWYIDNVNLTVNMTGNWTTLFFDDMENGDTNWYHMATYYNCHWHKESTFGNGPTAEWYWNGENKTWFGTGVLGSWETGVNWHEWTADNVAGDGGWDLYLAYEYAVAYPGASTADDEDDWLNITVDLSLSTSATFNFIAAGGWWYTPHTPPATTWYVTVTDGVTTINYPWVHPMDDNFYAYSLDLTPFAGSPAVTIGFHYNVTGAADHDVYIMIYSAELIGVGPTIPLAEYYNNVDEKLIFEFDLTHAYEAILKWDQNFSFADSYPDDYGVVEISTDGGNTWKALLIVQGNSGGAWGHSEIDISEYAGGDVPVKIRFRFISDGSNVDYGWLIDNVSIEGKVDYIAPTITATLDPATPDGNAGWYRSPVTVTLTASDNVKVAAIYYRIDGGPWKTYTAPFTIDIDGEHTVDYYAVDEVGNPSEMGSVSFKIDATAPSVEITYPTAGYIYLFGRELFKNPLGGTIIIGGITFKASASDATSGVDYVTFSIDGYTYEKATSPYEIWWHKFDFLPSKYTLTVSAYDEAGNKAADATLDFTHWL